MSLPTGFTVRVHDDIEAVGRGRVLIDGSPLRAVRLSARAEQLMEGRDLRVGVVADRLLDANLALPCSGMVTARTRPN